MLRRLLVLIVPLLVALVAALGVPLAFAVVQGESRETYLDRLGDAGRFASLAENALASGRRTALRDELVRYDRLYGIAAALVGTDRRVLESSRPDLRLTDPGVRAGLDAAFSGYRGEADRSVWPWEEVDLVVVEPVGRDSEVVAAVVTVSPTGGLRRAILRQWGLLALIGLAPALGVVAVAWPMSRWVLRPVRVLDEATAAVAGGELDVRADELGGPPELRRLAASFNAMVDVVGRALRRQRAFVSDASHQLRNPLAGLRLAVDNLAPHVTGDAGREAQRIAADEAEEMGRVLDALLAATRLDSACAAEPVEVDPLLAAHVPGWRALAGDVRFDVEVPGGLRVLEPPGGLGSVLDELVGNAVRLSGATRIRVWGRPAGDVVELHVTDDGEGLGEAERASAPRRFWRAPRHQNTPGTGLGLAICAELIASAGGELALRPVEPHGLDAVVTLRAGALGA
ncbi:sensor histidine kinase [Saccharothrix algeriensis]|uniref:Signal transduction histidine-protein kinase/phosphatase MprB n=1 Tax=Saccharothrix algeriensis TaxID=173560 RepID=A0A8T8HUD7_9PSEU|nr:HAMP domain-containing sensor histidine kinase [Saccharothrix algeriensis]MBM7813628.1 signal transduction histidine kinase [Saccharothrix algeriensis]QTR02112.1 HAMP domain-containing histidine kinase [Saccharothrix algeriensis]